MANNTRLIRINDEIMKETANIIRTQLKDPRIATLTSVVKTETTNDLSYTKVFVSVFGDDAQKKEVMAVLKNAAGFIRKEIAHKINLRTTPEFRFVLDDSLEYSARISKLIKEVSEQESQKDE